MKITLLICNLLCSFLLFSQCPDEFQFSSQSELDSFPINYPDCDSVLNGIFLFGDIYDPGPLDQIKYIKDYLIIQNTKIEHLDHFSNLEYVGNFIDILDNPALKTAKGFASLDGMQVKEYLGFQNNDSLENIDLDISDEAIFNLVITNNAELTEISVLNLTSVGGLNLSYDTNLTSINFPELQLIHSNLVLYKLDKIHSFGNFGVLNSIGGKVQIQENEILNSVDLAEVGELKTGLEIERNPILKSIEFPQNGMDTCLFVKINGNASLKSINGPALKFIQLNMEIAQNDALEQITGFEGLKKIKLSTRINQNALLTDISGLEDVFDLGNELQILDNPNLSQCSLNSICARIDSGKLTEIEGNGPSCMSKEEVFENCTSSTSNTEKAAAYIYPNPASDYISISLEADGRCDLYDVNGRLLKSLLTQNLNGEMDTSDLENGLYILRIGDFSRKIYVLR